MPVISDLHERKRLKIEILNRGIRDMCRTRQPELIYLFSQLIQLEYQELALIDKLKDDGLSSP